jgi:hypothetical protein
VAAAWRRPVVSISGAAPVRGWCCVQCAQHAPVPSHTAAAAPPTQNSAHSS